MAAISEETIEAVRSRADIAAVVSQYVTLKKRGRNLVGLCPFHSEKTGSFNVLPERGIWRCFGCGAGGNVFTFLMRIDGLTFPEAVERLANQVGVEITRDAAAMERRSQRQEIFDANRAAAEFYAQQLTRAPAARAVLERRGINEESIAALGLGYAPGEWEALSSTLLRRGMRGEVLAKAGLSRERETGGFYDLFRERIIFPIRDVEGRVLGFGGRAMGDVQPKYLNSPETMVFDKGRTLYGLDRARRAIADSGIAIVVEGYMDAAMAQQHGVLNVVATLGTALGQNHLELLRRYAPRVVLAYDGDAAGASAAERSLPLFESTEMEGRILVLPEGKDPDEFVREAGADAFRRAAQNALPLVEFQLRRLAARHDHATPEGRAALMQAVAPVLTEIRSAVKREEYVKRLAEEWCVGHLHRVQEVEEAIRREVRRAAGAHSGTPAYRPPAAGTAANPAAEAPPHIDEPAVPPRVALTERCVLQGILSRVVKADDVFEQITPADFQISAHRRLAEILWELPEGDEVADAVTHAGDRESTVVSLATGLLMEQERVPITRNLVLSSLGRIVQERRVARRIGELQDILQQPEFGPGPERVRLEAELRELKAAPTAQLADQGEMKALSRVPVEEIEALRQQVEALLGRPGAGKEDAEGLRRRIQSILGTPDVPREDVDALLTLRRRLGRVVSRD